MREEQAETAAQAANLGWQGARDALARTERAAREAADEAGRLAAALDAATHVRAAADRAWHQAQRDATQAEESARQAEELLAAATAHRRGLES